jgi:hypothetical protein
MNILAADKFVGCLAELTLGKGGHVGGNAIDNQERLA